MHDRSSQHLGDRQWLAVFETSFDAMLRVDEAGYCIAANPSACELFGYSRAALLTRNLMDLLGINPFQGPLGLSLEPQLQGQTGIQRADGQFRKVEWRAIAHLGPQQYLLILREAQAFPVMGMPEPLFIARKRTDATLSLRQMQERALLDNIPDLLLHLRRDGTCLNCILPREHADRFISVRQHIAEVLPPDLLEQELQVIAQVLETGEAVIHEHALIKHGRLLSEEVRVVPINADEVLVLVRDVTDRKQAEVALQETQAHLQDVLNNSAAYITRIWLFPDLTWRYEYMSLACERLYGYTTLELSADPTLWRSRVDPDDYATVIMPSLERILAGATKISIEYRFRHRDGSLRWISENSTIRDSDTREGRLITAVAIDITERKQAAAQMLQQRERERLLNLMTQHMRQSLNLHDILTTAVQEVRNLLNADRTLVYRFHADWTGEMVVESVQAPWSAVLETADDDPCFGLDRVEFYQLGQIHRIDNIHGAGLRPGQIERLRPLQIQASLVVPITCDGQLWGLIGVHQCSAPRAWEAWEVELLQQLSDQLAIALQQSELYQQVQHLNANLEQQVQERTLAMEQALGAESLLRQMTAQVRDSLDEHQILQTAVESLGGELAVLCCDVGLYDDAHTTVTICWEYNAGLDPLQGVQFAISEASDPEIYHRHLFRGETTQVCSLRHNPVRPHLPPCAFLVCPIRDDQGVLGDIWLVKPQDQFFSDSEVLLVQQVANQCAIALRQARLYQMAQAQVSELERLNRLKDDFLSTVSHELRTPMANIKMAAEMVELRLAQAGMLGPSGDAPLERYFNILKDACQREIHLIDDLLDLTRLNSDVDPIIPFLIQLKPWVIHIAESFRDRIQRHQQSLQIDIPADLALESDLAYMERIIMELLNNACKYTPAGEGIFISGRLLARGIQLVFANSGIELPPEECDRIFEQFYRIPSNDPWRYEGTGLGLALVRKLTEKMGGTIRAESSQHQFRIILEFPLL